MSEMAQPKTPRPRKPRQAKPRACVLPESLTIRTAREFVLAMRSACTRSVPVLDGSAVAEVDTAGLQVLVATAAAARVSGAGLRWSAVSPTLLNAVTGFGLGDCLGLVAASELAVMAPGRG